MTRKHHVSFIAEKKVKEPVTVDFKIKTGKEIKFPAHMKVSEKVKVKFMAKNKRK